MVKLTVLAVLIAMMGCVSQETESGVENIERISPNGPDGATAKCISLGYEGDLRDACVRAIHADFCGDGVSLTAPGILIDIHDVEGVVSDTNDWAVEAEWTAAGAACISSNAATRFSQVAHASPACELVIAEDCGLGTHGSIVTKLPALGI